MLSHPKYRADIDGLRAIAVLSVALYHFFPHALPGGFVGVDIFFVISGFLISTIIYENLNNNSFSFLSFYSRRIRRIFPSLILVLLFSLIIGSILLFPNELQLLSKHILSGSAFVSNFILWNESGYFDATAEFKPLLHLWSLGIEEQFYIFFPFLIYFAHKKKLNLLTFTILLFLISYFLNINSIKKDAVAVFYAPWTRIWELLAGAILARFLLGGESPKFIQNKREKINNFLHSFIFSNKEQSGKTLENSLANLGFVFILISIFFFHSKLAFPGKYALLPVLGAFLIIWAGKNADFNSKILSHQFFVFIGKISYPFYLWHWPLLCFFKMYYGGTPPRLDRLILLIITIFLSYLTTRFFENPIRFGKNAHPKIILLIVTMLILGIAGGIVFKTIYIEPERNDFYGKAWTESWGQWRYFGNRSAEKRILIMGDSHSAHFELQVIEKLGKEYKIDRIAGACMASKTRVEPQWEAQRANCQNMQNELLKTKTPDIVIVGNYLSGYSQIMDSSDNFYKHLDDVVALFEPLPKKIIFVGDPGNIDVLCEQANHRSRFTRTKKQCAPPRSPEPYLNFSRWSRAKKFPDFVHFVYPFEMLCDEKGHCRAYGEKGANFWDDNHLTFWGSEPVAAEIAKIILEK